jgi:hypothetical protein
MRPRAMSLPNRATVALVATAALVAACGGATSTESPIVLGGTVFWGPQADTVVDRAFVRIRDSARAERCVATRCDGTFVFRRSDLRSLRLPVVVSVERAREPEAIEPVGLALRTLPEPIDETNPALSLHLFDTEAEADAAKLAPTGSCAPGVEPDLVECPEDRR